MTARALCREQLEEALRARVLVLDGAMGTMIEAAGLDEADFRGVRFDAALGGLKGNHELLTLTRPDVITGIHREFLRAGADIITTNSFNANSSRQAGFGLDGIVYELNLEAARLARQATVEVSGETPYWPRFVAGAIGPRLRASGPEDYLEPIRGLLDGGADLIMLETVLDEKSVFDALDAADTAFAERECRLPVMISFAASDHHAPVHVPPPLINRLNQADIWDVGFNCTLDAHNIGPGLRDLAAGYAGAVSIYPNARLKDGSVADPNAFSDLVGAMAGDALVNMVGGCCGTTPAHIARLAARVLDMTPRICPRHLNSGPGNDGGLAWAS